MPKVAIFCSILLLTSLFANSYAFTTGDAISNTQLQTIDFDSDIIHVDSEFFSENDFKRYIVFGSNSHYPDSLAKNSLYGMHTNNGFFSVAILDENSA